MGEEPAVDVARLMEEIKERVRQRKASGFYSEEAVRRITQMELEIQEVLPGYRDELDLHLGTLNEIWDPKEPEPITSHRRVVGPAIVALKRVVQRLGRPFIGLALARQARVNSHLVQLLNSFAPQIRDHLRELAHRPVDDPVFGIGIFRRDGVCCYGTNTAIEGLALPKLDGEGEVSVSLERLDLVEGEYLLDVAVHARDGQPYDYHSRLYPFAIRSRVKDAGVARLPHRWRLGK